MAIITNFVYSPNTMDITHIQRLLLTFLVANDNQDEDGNKR